MGSIGPLTMNSGDNSGVDLCRVFKAYLCLAVCLVCLHGWHDCLFSGSESV